MKKSGVPSKRDCYGAAINEIYADGVFTKMDVFHTFTGFIQVPMPRLQEILLMF